MHRSRFACLLLICCLLLAAFQASALDLEADSVHCFSESDFSEEGSLAGICILSLPDAEAGCLMLGSRVLRPGDILSASQISQMTFLSLPNSQDLQASMQYLPVFSDHVAPETTLVFSIRGKQDAAPVAEDLAVETYKNLPLEQKLKVTDPEGQAMRFSLVRAPKRGTVELREDGSFVYTPKHNKVGVDSFVFTAVDPAGNVSREATVTVKILRPSDARQYSDTTGTSCRFEAEWLKNKGIFVGEEVAGQRCFHPEANVTRGEFLAMALQALEVPVEEVDAWNVFSDSVPQWLQCSLSAALRCGALNGLPQSEEFGAELPITGAEAAVILQNILKLVPNSEPETANVDGITTFGENPLAWAEDSLSVMAQNGIEMDGSVLTREDAAKILYAAYKLSEDAPGMAAFR